MVVLVKSEELSKTVRQMELLHRIGLEIISVLDLDKLLTTVSRATNEMLGYDNCAIFLLEEDHLVLKASYYFPPEVRGMKIKTGEGIVGKCAKEVEIINIGDISDCPFYIPSGLGGINSEIALPIVFGEQLLGALTIESTRKEAFTEDDEKVLSILCSLLGVSIRNVRMTRSKYKEMELLHQTGLKIVSNIDLEMLLTTIVNLVSVNLGYANCAIFLPIEDKLVLKAQSHFPEKVLGLEIKFGSGTVGRCAQEKEVINIGDVPSCDFYIPSGLKGIQSAIAMPILYEDRLLGVLATESQKKNVYQEEDVRVLNILCSQMGVALRNAEMVAQLERLAITDSLTGLYNYRYFSKRLEQETERARRYKRDLSLILIDLDNFKMVNDLFGHMKGDEVLVEVAQLILDNIRKTDHSSIMKEVAIDIPVRYGGEELMILLPETPLEGAINAAQRLNKLLRERVNKKVTLIKEDGEQLIISGSFGAASLKPQERGEDLIKRVNQAMYEAKKKGKDQVHWLE